MWDGNIGNGKAGRCGKYKTNICFHFIEWCSCGNIAHQCGREIKNSFHFIENLTFFKDFESYTIKVMKNRLEIIRNIKNCCHVTGESDPPTQQFPQLIICHFDLLHKIWIDYRDWDAVRVIYYGAQVGKK